MTYWAKTFEETIGKLSSSSSGLGDVLPDLKAGASRFTTETYQTAQTWQRLLLHRRVHPHGHSPSTLGRAFQSLLFYCRGRVLSFAIHPPPKGRSILADFR
jgi:hypothetical protein